MHSESTPVQFKDDSTILAINNQHRIYSITFTDDGKQVLSGGGEGMLRRWRVDSGHEIDEPIRANGAKIYAIAVSLCGKWLVLGLKFSDGNKSEARAGVWNAQTGKKVLGVHGHTTDSVLSVDVSPDSSTFATGGSDKLAFVWSLSTGERLVGPLQHDGWVVAVRFSPSGDRIATATAENPDVKSIRVFDSKNGQQLLDVPFSTKAIISSPLAWSVDGGYLLAVSHSEVKYFNASSGSLRAKWTIPGKGQPASIALAHNGKFIVVSSHNSVSFWDAITHEQIGVVEKHTSVVWSFALSPDDDYIATGEENGEIIIRCLCDILPDSYFMVKLPLMHLDDAVFKCWTQGDLTCAEEFLTKEIEHPIREHALQHVHALAHRALVRIRLKQWNLAVDDAKKSIQARRSVIGHIARALTYIGSGDHVSATRSFDLVFTDSLTTENKFLLLIKAIVLFECGKRDDAISRVDDLIDIVNNRSLYITVRAQMFLLLGSMLLKEGDEREAMRLLERAKEAIPFQWKPHFVVLSLFFGWHFDKLDLAIQQHLQECVKAFEGHGDVAVSTDPNEAIHRYSAALSLNPPNPAGILAKRSRARAMLRQWEDALEDADEAIKIDPQDPWGYKRRHVALHGLQRYDEAIEAFTHMHSLIEASPDPDAHQLAKKYISPSRSMTIIDDIMRGVFRISPLVLIDVKSGRLCDGLERMHMFKSEVRFKELVSSMMQGSDNGHIQGAVEGYFLYVTFSHVWRGKEPSFQDVSQAGTIWELDSSPLNEKLRRFCEVVRSSGYRWAWCDTCCIDKTNNAVLNQSLTTMYKWYEASTATFVFLSDVNSSSALGDLTHSVWMTRAWTAQELLAGKVVRFYDCNWKPYLGDIRSNHKESSEIMQELADAIRVTRETIVSFKPDDLTVREKLRLASTRNATIEEDVAYSLIGIFKSDIMPRYGEGDAALGHLLEEIVARSGEVTVLDWIGKPSSYNSCLPATLAVYSQPPCASPAVDDTEMNLRVAALKKLLPQTDAIQIHERVTHLPPARFANRRLHLPCIIFAVKKLGLQDFGSGRAYHYRARVSGIGDVEFQTSDQFSLVEPRRLIFVRPWLRDLHDPLDGFTWGGTTDDDEPESDPETEGSPATSPLHALPSTTIDDYTQALRVIVRLQQPSRVLLLQQQPNGTFKRVAAEHEIVMPGIEPSINFARDVRTEVVDIL